MLGSNFALLVKSPGDDGQQLLTTGSRLCISLPTIHSYQSRVVPVAGGRLSKSVLQSHCNMVHNISANVQKIQHAPLSKIFVSALLV